MNWTVISPYQTETHTHTTNSAPRNHHQARHYMVPYTDKQKQNWPRATKTQRAHTSAHTATRKPQNLNHALMFAWETHKRTPLSTQNPASCTTGSSTSSARSGTCRFATKANSLARLVKKGGSGRRRRLARGHRAEPAPGHDDRGHVAMLRGRPQLEPVARAPVCKLVSRATLLGVIHADRRQVRLDAALGEGTLKPYMILRAAHLPNAGLCTRQ